MYYLKKVTDDTSESINLKSSVTLCNLNILNDFV